MALPLANTFETGLADETDITLENSADGSAGTAFNEVLLNGGSIKYDTARAAHGSLSARMNPVTNGRLAVIWATDQIGTPAEVWGRAYVYRTANPVAENQWVIRFEDIGAAQGIILWTWGGTLAVYDNTFSWTDSPSGGWVANQWNRLEFHWKNGAGTGIIEAKVWNSADSSDAADATATFNNCQLGTSTLNQVLFGSNDDGLTDTAAFWMDDLQVNETGYPGPATAPSSPGISSLSGMGW